MIDKPVEYTPIQVWLKLRELVPGALQHAVVRFGVKIEDARKAYDAVFSRSRNHVLKHAAWDARWINPELTADEIRAIRDDVIRSLQESGMDCGGISARLGVSTSMVYRVMTASTKGESA